MGGCYVGLKYSPSCPLGSAKFMGVSIVFFLFKTSFSSFLFISLCLLHLPPEVHCDVEEYEVLSLIFWKNKS